MPRICFVRNATFGNYLSWLHHQARGSSHVTRGMGKLLNKSNSPMTSVRKDSSKDAQTLEMLPSSSSSSS